MYNIKSTLTDLLISIICIIHFRLNTNNKILIQSLNINISESTIKCAD